VEAWDASQTQKLGTGKLTALDNQIDTTTGTLKLRATFQNRQDVLYPNQFVNTRLLVTTEHNKILIPSQAIQHNGQESFVFLIVNGKKPNQKIAKMQDVTPGVTNEGMTAVTGIQAGDVVATSSFEKLRNGSEVRIAKAAAASSSSESNAP
jgi:multidrug efflux system membrane fusion protein